MAIQQSRSLGEAGQGIEGVGRMHICTVVEENGKAPWTENWRAGLELL